MRPIFPWIIPLEKQSLRLFSALANLVYKDFSRIRSVRYELARSYREKLLPFRDQFAYLPQDEANLSLLRFPIVLKDGKRRDKILSRLKKRGLGASEAYPVPLHRQPGVTSYVETEVRLPWSKLRFRKNTNTSIALLCNGTGC